MTKVAVDPSSPVVVRGVLGARIGVEKAPAALPNLLLVIYITVLSDQTVYIHHTGQVLLTSTCTS